MARLSPEPKTHGDWQAVMDAIQLLQAIDSARQYGLITGGPQLNHERCDRLWEKGRALGYRARPLEEIVPEFRR